MQEDLNSVTRIHIRVWWAILVISALGRRKQKLPVLFSSVSLAGFMRSRFSELYLKWHSHLAFTYIHRDSSICPGKKDKKGHQMSRWWEGKSPCGSDWTIIFRVDR